MQASVYCESIVGEPEYSGYEAHGNNNINDTRCQKKLLVLIPSSPWIDPLSSPSQSNGYP
jgi:hypothetical protein